MARFGSAFGGFASGLDAGRAFQLKQQERADLQAATQAAALEKKIEEAKKAFNEGITAVEETLKQGGPVPDGMYTLLEGISTNIVNLGGTDFSPRIEMARNTPPPEDEDSYVTIYKHGQTPKMVNQSELGEYAKQGWYTEHWTPTTTSFESVYNTRTNNVEKIPTSDLANAEPGHYLDPSEKPNPNWRREPNLDFNARYGWDDANTGAFIISPPEGSKEVPKFHIVSPELQARVDATLAAESKFIEFDTLKDLDYFTKLAANEALSEIAKLAAKQKAGFGFKHTPLKNGQTLQIHPDGRWEFIGEVIENTYSYEPVEGEENVFIEISPKGKKKRVSFAPDKEETVAVLNLANNEIEYVTYSTFIDNLENYGRPEDKLSPQKIYTELQFDDPRGTWYEVIDTDGTKSVELIKGPLTAEQEKIIEANAKLAAAPIEGQAAAIKTVAEQSYLLDSGILTKKAVAEALARLEAAPIVAETKVTIEKALNDPDLLSHIALAEAVAADAAAELRGRAKGKEAAAAVKFNQITYHPTDIPGLYKEEKPNGEVTLKWLDADAREKQLGRWGREQTSLDALHATITAKWEGEAEAKREIARLQTLADNSPLTWEEVAIAQGFMKKSDREMRVGPNGNLRYVDDGSLVFPNIEKEPKIWSPINLYSPDLDEFITLNKNTDQAKIAELTNPQNDTVWHQVSVNVDRQDTPEGALETAAGRDEQKRQYFAYGLGIELFTDAIGRMEENLRRVGPSGSIKTLLQEFIRSASELGFDVKNFKDRSRTMLDNFEGGVDVEVYGWFDDPGLSELEVLERSLAAIYARVLNPKDRLLKSQIDDARKLLKQKGLRSGQSVLEKYKTMLEHMESKREDSAILAGIKVKEEKSIDEQIADLEKELEKELKVN